LVIVIDYGMYAQALDEIQFERLTKTNILNNDELIVD